MIWPPQQDANPRSSIPPAPLRRNGGFRLVSFARFPSKRNREEQGKKPVPNKLYFVHEITRGVVRGEYIPSVELRNFTSGTASFSMEPSHYAPVKEELADLRVAS